MKKIGEGGQDLGEKLPFSSLTVASKFLKKEENHRSPYVYTRLNKGRGKNKDHLLDQQLEEGTPNNPMQKSSKEGDRIE